MADYLPPVVGRLVGDNSDFTAKVRASKADSNDLERHSRAAGAAGNTALANVGDGAQRAGGHVSGLRTAVGALATGLAVVGGISLLGGFISEATEAQKVGSQTAAVIASTGGAANVTAVEVSNLADAISRKTGIDDEQVASASNMLLTFTNVANAAGAGNDVFNQATATALDMSVALGTDATNSAMMLGKALNDPVQGMSALRRVGVAFTDDQEAQVKALVATGDTLGAQKLILAELSKEFAGSAEAQATAGDKIKVVWANVQETVGTALLPVISTILPTFESAVGALAPALEPIGHLVASIVDAIGPAIPPLIPIVTSLVLVFGNVLNALTPIIPPVLGLISAFEPLIPLVGGLVTTLVSAFIPVLGSLVGALVPVVTTILEHLEPVLDQVKPIITQLAGSFLQVVVALLPLLPPIGQLIVAMLPLVPVILEINLAWLQLLPVLMPVIELFVQFAALLIGGLAEGITFAIGLFSDFDGTLRGIGDAAGAVWDFFSTLPGVILGLVAGAPGWLVDIGAGIIGGLWSGITAAVPAVLSWLASLPGQIIGLYAGAISWLVGAGWSVISGMFSGLVGAVEGMWSWLSGLPGQIIDLYADAISWLVGAGWNIISGILDGAQQGFANLWSWLSGFPGRVWDAIGDIAGDVVGIGENVVIGIWNGIAGMGDWLWDRIADFARSAIPGPIRDILGISSPSTMMAGYGINIAQGLAVGIEVGTPQVVSAATSMIAALNSAVAMASVEVPAPAVAGGGPIHEDDPRWDWRTMGNRQRGVTVNGRLMIQHADGSLTDDHPLRDVPNAYAASPYPVPAVTDDHPWGEVPNAYAPSPSSTPTVTVYLSDGAIRVDGAKDPEAVAYALRDLLLRDSESGRTPHLWS